MLTNLGDDAIKQVNQHGAGLLPFLNNYTDEGLQLINNSDEAAEFVLKHWDDAPERVALAVDYGKPAMQLLDTVDTTQSRKLLSSLDTVDIESVLTLSDDGIKQLGKLDADTLAQFAGKMDLVSDYGDVGLKYVLKDGDDVARRLDLLDNINTKYLGDIVDNAGNINTSNMRDLRLAIEHGNFGADEISLICQSVGDKGITAAYEAEMKKVKFGEYLTNTIGGPPITDQDVKWHAHHILFKEGATGAQKALVAQGQAILRKYGIDPVVGPENLVWAPLYVEGQHALPALEDVVASLVEADVNGGTYDDVAEALELLGDIANRRR